MTESAKEYGMALFDLAKEKSKTDEYAGSLETVSEVLKSNPEFLDVLSSPRLPAGKGSLPRKRCSVRWCRAM